MVNRIILNEVTTLKTALFIKNIERFLSILMHRYWD